VRAGALGLTLLSDPLDAPILKALEDGPMPLIDLRQTVGSPAETTLRKHLKSLTDLGLLTKCQQPEFPGPVTYELTSSGRELCTAAAATEAWLKTAPGGPMPFGRPVAKSALKSVVDAWTTKMARALAVKPLSLTELDRLLPSVNYPALERRLTAMRLAGQIEPMPGRAGSTPYRVTRWMREAVAPLIAAANWESRHHPTGREPLGRLDFEAILLLAIPLVTLPSAASGTCQLTVDLPNSRQDVAAGVAVAIENGYPVSCTANLSTESTSTVRGPGPAWLAVLMGEIQTGILFDGDKDLGEDLVSALARLCARQLPTPLTAI
jgi:DNA-binding HxlR family transcriptional regulator